jgi:glucan phosphoethanolaminetransferase (alkaline phosphatase superfamily)
MSLAIIAFFPVLILIVIFFLAAKAEENNKEKNNMTLKKAYLYLVSVISLVIAVVGAILLINMALKTWVFPKADQNYYSYPCAAQPVAVDGKTFPCDQAALDQQKKMDQENQAAQKQRDAAQALAMLLVATPVWWFHWRLAKREA